LKNGKLCVPMPYCVERKIQISSMNRGWIDLTNRRPVYLDVGYKDVEDKYV
jgi:hypothetical protein